MQATGFKSLNVCLLYICLTILSLDVSAATVDPNCADDLRKKGWAEGASFSQSIDPLAWTSADYKIHSGELRHFNYQTERPLPQRAYPLKDMPPAVQELGRKLWQMSFDPERVAKDQKWEAEMQEFVREHVKSGEAFHPTVQQYKRELEHRGEIHNRSKSRAVEAGGFVLVMKDGSVRMAAGSSNRVTHTHRDSVDESGVEIFHDFEEIATVYDVHTHPAYSVPLAAGDTDVGDLMVKWLKGKGVEPHYELIVITESKDHELVVFEATLVEREK